MPVSAPCSYAGETWTAPSSAVAKPVSFSLYIDEELNVMPCSFCNDPARAFSLRATALSSENVQ